MSNIAGSNSWAENVYLIEENDRNTGGPEGVVNRASKALANRTVFLKAWQTEHESSLDPHAMYTTEEWVVEELFKLLDSAPPELNTLGKLATALLGFASFPGIVGDALHLKAPLDAPTFTGLPTGPTADADTTGTQLATVGFVLGQLATASPADNGTATLGTSKRFARGDHAHATDATRAPVASPRFTGDGLGYGGVVGTGGAVAQATSKATGVTLNKPCGQITLNNAALAAGATIAFVLTCDKIVPADVVLASIGSGATSMAYTLQVEAVAGGSCRICLRNVSAASLGEALVVNFAIMKSVVA